MNGNIADRLIEDFSLFAFTPLLGIMPLHSYRTASRLSPNREKRKEA